MITLLAAAGNSALLLVEGDPAGTPRLMTGALGSPYDFSHVIFVGASADLATNNVTVQTDANTSINPGVLRSQNIMWAPLGPDLVGGPTPAYDVDLDGGGITPPGPLAGGSVFRARSGELNSFRLRNGAILDGSNLAAAGECISRIRPSFPNEVVLTVESYGGIIGPKAFLNPSAPTPNPPFPPIPTTGIISMNMDAKTIIDPAYQAPGGLSPVGIAQDMAKRDTAVYMAYDDALALPPLGATDIQTIIDILKVNTLSGLTVNRPSPSFVGQQYFDTTIGMPTWWDGSNWAKADGTIVP